jgi:glucosamine-6-phosphate deaminase
MTTTEETWTLRVVRDAATMSEAAGDIVTETVTAKPQAVIAVPTGTTPLGMFDVLAARSARGEVDFSRVRLFCLDEYLGVSADHPNSLTRWLFDAFSDRVGIPRDHVHIVPATASDPETAAEAYERELAAAGGLDLAVLGMGPNGHIAFNEPGSPPDSRTRVIALTPESIAQASAYWRDSQPAPSHAMTMGVGTLLEARRLVLIVSGEAKAGVVRAALKEPLSAAVPASWLRRAGPRLEIILDAAAASNLPGNESAR